MPNQNSSLKKSIKTIANNNLKKVLGLTLNRILMLPRMRILANTMHRLQPILNKLQRAASSLLRWLRTVTKSPRLTQRSALKCSIKKLQLLKRDKGMLAPTCPKSLRNQFKCVDHLEEFKIQLKSLQLREKKLSSENTLKNL